MGKIAQNVPDEDGQRLMTMQAVCNVRGLYLFMVNLRVTHKIVRIITVRILNV